MSLYLEPQRGEEKRTFLLDFGWTPEAINGNMELLKLEAKIDLVHVPYKDAPSMFRGMLTGEVQAQIQPLQTAAPQVANGNARMVIEPKGIWEHAAYQADNRFIIEVKPVQDDPNKLVQLAVIQSSRITEGEDARLWVDVRHLSLEQFGDQLAGRGGHRQAEHVVARRNQHVPQRRAAVDDR